jgi:hypothetical protein
VNDTVVVFDRVRENRSLQYKLPFGKVTNDAILQTIPRTVNTGIGALAILAALVPIVTEAGGRFTSLDGERGPWGGNALATNGALHDEVLGLLSPRDPSDEP